MHGQLLLQLLNGLAYGLLLFLLAAGLSMIFGLMDVLNLAHGTFYLLGGYVAVSVSQKLGSLWYALILAPLAVALFGVLMERFLIRFLYKRGHLLQGLLTFGFVFIVSDLSRLAWGSRVLSVEAPAPFEGSLQIFGQYYPTYRLFIIGFGLLLALGLWLLQEKTRVGAILRAGVSDRAMISALGINIGKVFTLFFGLGAGVAALAGVVAQPLLSVYPGADFDILLLTLIVVVVGGLGSLTGAFWGAILVGIVDNLAKAYIPSAAMFVIFALMVVVLIARPTGLFGRGAT